MYERMSHVVEVPKALIVPNVSSYFRFQYRLVCSSLSKSNTCLRYELAGTTSISFVRHVFFHRSQQLAGMDSFGDRKRF